MNIILLQAKSQQLKAKSQQLKANS